jgi:hypothetical protein
MFAPRGWLKRPVARRIYRAIASSDLFDARWYRSTQVSGAAAIMDPVWHYLDHGARAGLDPSPRFDTSHYVHAHHDVRNSGLNPLFHYLEYGIEERRSPLRSVIGTRDVLLPETAELETFTSPQTSSPRVTLVTDSRSEPESSRSLAEIVQAAHTFAQKNSRTLRVIAWPGSGDLSTTSLRGVTVVEARRSHPAPTFEVHADEFFIATSTTSALSLRHVAPHSHLWKLSSKKNTTFVPRKSPPSLSELPAGPSRSQGIPSTGRVPLPSDLQKKTVVVFADTLSNPVGYLHTLESLDQLFLDHAELGNAWQVVVCGQGVEPLMLAGTVSVPHADYVSRTDMGRVQLAMMATVDKRVEKWCEESGVPVVSATTGPSLASALMESRS